MYRDPFLLQMQDSVRYPPINPSQHGTKYTDIVRKQMAGLLTATPLETIGKVHTLFLETCHDLPANTFNTMWDKLLPRLSNQGLVQFLLDHGAASRFFVPWLFQIPTADALDVAFGYGLSVDGTWQTIPEDDAFFWWVIREPMFVYLRERASLTVNAIAERKRILFLAAGKLPELRYAGFSLNDGQSVFACDLNPLINPDALFCGGALNNGITYTHDSIWTYLNDKNLNDSFDAVVMNGLASYMVDDLEPIIKGAINLLQNGGIFIFDLQLAHWSMVRDALVFNWQTEPPMYLFESKESAIHVVKSICDSLPCELLIKADSRNDTPTGVMFTIRKDEPAQ